MKNISCRPLSLLVILAGWIASTHLARADHRNATNGLADPRTDIGEVYAFVSQISGNVVLAMTVNGFTVPGVNPTFAPGCLYQFKIDNTGDFIEDLVIQVVFGKPVGPAFSPMQGFTVVGPVKPPKKGGSNKLAKANETPIPGAINNSGSNAFTSASNGIKVFCGIRDDPFFFDEIPIRNIVQAGAPVPSQTRTPGVDYYAGLNCSVIAIELPSALISGTLTNPTSGQKQLNVWATTSVPASVTRSLRAPIRGEPLEIRESTSKSFVQHDRVALPCVSTFLVAEVNRNAFCAGQPKDDVKFFAEPARPLIERLQPNPADPNAILIADQLLANRFPDVLRLDVAGNAATGRRPLDDVIDRELNLLTVGVLTGDAVNGNDFPFLTDFPFFAPPHPVTQGVPPRN